MPRVVATTTVPEPIFNAEELWFDPTRWAAFVDGFAHVHKIEGDWPRGGAISWNSHPDGRGRVIEEVVWFSAREGQDVRVEDTKLTGTQRVRFTPGRVTLELEYKLKESMWLVDLLFIRGQLRQSLRRTLRRFAIELEADRELAQESG
jgi:hypothetical protein